MKLICEGMGRPYSGTGNDKYQTFRVYDKSQKVELEELRNVTIGGITVKLEPWQKKLYGKTAKYRTLAYFIVYYDKKQVKLEFGDEYEYDSEEVQAILDFAKEELAKPLPPPHPWAVAEGRTE